ncbi:MAG TPA: transaldolase [Acidimicrobiales bacterium]|nr:transaldolase [Acidimicrobiales bacterium]
MKPTEKLHTLGQSLWLDNITRGLLDGGDIERYIDTHSLSGLTSNPSIFDAAIATGDYDESIKAASGQGLSNEEIFYGLAIADLQRAADLFAPVHERTDGIDGWVSLEVSPLLAYDTDKTVEAAKSLHERARRDNLFIKIPGTPPGLPAIEECIASGVPINVTLLFDADQYRASADAYLRGIERRVASGLDPNVACVASIFVSRWDVAVAKSVPEELKNQLGLAVGHEAYRAYRDVMESDRCQRLANFGARTQRLLWASTKTKDPTASDTLYIAGLAAPFTINTMPNSTLDAFFDHGELGDPLARDGGDCDAVLERFAKAGVDQKALALKLQDDGAASFVASWKELLKRIDSQLSSAHGSR